MEPLNWCFIGAGSIAKRVLQDLYRNQAGRLCAVYSRTMHHASALADRYGGTAYDSIDAALQHKGIDAVYIATPHIYHCAHTCLALRHGFPVLCEKPFALSEAEANAMTAAARRNNRFLMEGMWTRFNPVIVRVLHIIQSGKLGQIKWLSAQFASSAARSTARLFDPQLGGGSLYDIGVYPLALARFVFGETPVAAQADAHMDATGVDLSCAVTLRYASGSFAQLFSSLEVRTAHTACIYGENGSILIPKFWAPDTAEVTIDGKTETIRADLNGEGFHFEFLAFADALRKGGVEHDMLPHTYSISQLSLLDKIREQIGLSFS